MKPIIERIKQALKTEHFVVIQIYGGAGTGKTALAENILEEFSDYDIRKIHSSRGLKKAYAHDMIEFFEDASYKWIETPRDHKIHISELYTKPRLFHNANLIRIIVVNRKIDLVCQFDAYKEHRRSIIDITTGCNHIDLEYLNRQIVEKFTIKYLRVFKKRLKTRPYLITTTPLEIGRYKNLGSKYD